MADLHITIAAETIFHVGSFPVTNSLIMSWVAILLIVGIGLAFTRKIRLVPGKMQGIGELIVDTGISFCANVMGSRKNAEKAFPLVATFFLLILLSNWLGLIPGVGSIGIIEASGGYEEKIPILRPTYADMNMTIALAVVSVLATHIFGILSIGAFVHIKKFINFSSPVNFFVGILELFGEISKMVSFSFRLFGNVFAGEVLLVVILALVPFIAPLPFYGLEVFVGFIQALVFSMLTLVFIQVAMMETEH